MEKNINTIQNSDLNNGTLFVLQNVDITGISRDLSIAFWNSKFVYDNLDRMTTAQYGEGTSLSDNINHYTENITGYTKNGAITGLQRYGKTTNNDYGLIDNLTYTLSGNELKKVTNASTNIPANNGMHFVDGANQDTEYTYDANGNLTQDLNKGINITYNVLDLPNTVTTQSGTVNYLYTADGVKRQVKHGTNTTDYADNLVYENGKLSKILTAEGYITLDSLNKPTYHYYLKDHEGNNRVVIDQNGTVEQVNHYYPFGTLFSESTNAATQRYKYNGKELDTDYGLNLYDYGARYYDPILGQWTTQDPLAEKYYLWSPYNYCANNPIKNIDTEGLDVWEIDANGNVVNRKTDTRRDAFYKVQKDENGKYQRRTNEDGSEVSISFAYGTIKSQKDIKVKVENANGEVEKDKITIFKVEGDKNASDLYNFMINSQTNNVEWGLVQIGSANSGQNLLGTMNDTKGSGMGLYALEYGYTVRRSDHNHPLGTTTPSRDDVNNAKSISDKFPKAQFNIYVSPREPIPYNKKSPYIKPAYPGATYGNIQSAKKW
jgi:RHS repeat-associated protein